MPSPPKSPKRSSPTTPPAKPADRGAVVPLAPIEPTATTSSDLGLGVAVAAEGGGGTITARRAGTLRDMRLEVDPEKVGVRAALQHLAKAVNIAFQVDFGENELESVYQAAIVRNGELRIVHREYFGFRDSWFSQFGKLLRSLQLTLEGPDPASPEGQKRIVDKGPASIRGLFNLLGRKLDLIAEYEDRVPAYVEQMFDRLEASGIIVGWDRNNWEIRTTAIGLDIVIGVKEPEVVGEGE
jgi:hypothetical protein